MFFISFFVSFAFASFRVFLLFLLSSCWVVECEKTNWLVCSINHPNLSTVSNDIQLDSVKGSLGVTFGSKQIYEMEKYTYIERGRFRIVWREIQIFSSIFYIWREAISGMEKKIFRSDCRPADHCRPSFRLCTFHGYYAGYIVGFLVCDQATDDILQHTQPNTKGVI